MALARVPGVATTTAATVEPDNSAGECRVGLYIGAAKAATSTVWNLVVLGGNVALVMDNESDAQRPDAGLSAGARLRTFANKEANVLHKNHIVFDEAVYDDDARHKLRAAYAGRFETCSSLSAAAGRVALDASPSHVSVYTPENVRRLFEHDEWKRMPVIMTVRNPVTRTLSHARHVATGNFMPVVNRLQRDLWRLIWVTRWQD